MHKIMCLRRGRPPALITAVSCKRNKIALAVLLKISKAFNEESALAEESKFFRMTSKYCVYLKVRMLGIFN